MRRWKWGRYFVDDGYENFVELNNAENLLPPFDAKHNKRYNVEFQKNNQPKRDFMMEIWATDWHFEGKHPSARFIAKDVICLKADDKEVVMCKGGITRP